MTVEKEAARRAIMLILKASGGRCEIGVGEGDRNLEVELLARSGLSTASLNGYVKLGKLSQHRRAQDSDWTLQLELGRANSHGLAATSEAVIVAYDKVA